MVDVSRKDVIVAALLRELGGLCDRGFALAIHIRYTRPTLLYQTYTQEWGDYYSENGFMLVDPTVHWGLSNVGAIEWDQLVPQDSSGVIAAARTYGLINGWTYAVGPTTSRSLGSLARSVPFTSDSRARCCTIIDEIHTVTEGFDQFPTALQETLRSLPV